MANQNEIPIDIAQTAVAAALQNGGRLVNDARLLLDAGSAPTAHSLATLAMEEAVKAFDWATEIAGAKGAQTVKLKPTKHEERLKKVHVVLATMRDHFDREGKPATEAEMLEDAAKLAKKSNLEKQRGFYVDPEPQSVRLPSEIDVASATQMVDVAEGIVGLALLAVILAPAKR